ncbi:MAG: hypothetical protein ACJ72J_04425 [Nitrososphaeraceae archaeon]
MLKCIICNRKADGFVEVALGWRDEPKTRLYLCRADYDIVYSQYKQEWHTLE